MPKSNEIFKPTISFNHLCIDTLPIQEAPKFLLRCIKNIEKNREGYFTYGSLIEFMNERCEDINYYKGSGIKSRENIKQYWRYANSDKHSAKIPDFKKYINSYESI